MARQIFRGIVISCLAGFLAIGLAAHASPQYNYQAQRSMIPPDLGQLYLGMSLRELASKIDLKKAEASARYGPLQVEIPFSKGNVTSLMVRVHGLDDGETSALLRPDKVIKKGDDVLADIEVKIQRLEPSKISAKGIVSSMVITFKPTFDLQSFASKAYGKGEKHPIGERHRFFDEQWITTTSDGLGWMIRAFYNGKAPSLQLLGRIPGSEWDPEA